MITGFDSLINQAVTELSRLGGEGCVITVLGPEVRSGNTKSYPNRTTVQIAENRAYREMVTAKSAVYLSALKVPNQKDGVAYQIGDVIWTIQPLDEQLATLTVVSQGDFVTDADGNTYTVVRQPDVQLGGLTLTIHTRVKPGAI